MYVLSMRLFFLGSSGLEGCPLLPYIWYSSTPLLYGLILHYGMYSSLAYPYIIQYTPLLYTVLLYDVTQYSFILLLYSLYTPFCTNYPIMFLVNTPLL